MEFPEVNPNMLAFNGLSRFCDECGPFSFCITIYKRPGSEELSWVVPKGAQSRDATIGILTRVINSLSR